MSGRCVLAPKLEIPLFGIGTWIGGGVGVLIGAGSNSLILGGAYPLQSRLDLMHLVKMSVSTKLSVTMMDEPLAGRFPFVALDPSSST